MKKIDAVIINLRNVSDFHINMHLLTLIPNNSKFKTSIIYFLNDSLHSAIPFI